MGDYRVQNRHAPPAYASQLLVSQIRSVVIVVTVHQVKDTPSLNNNNIILVNNVGQYILRIVRRIIIFLLPEIAHRQLMYSCHVQLFPTRRPLPALRGSDASRIIPIMLDPRLSVYITFMYCFVVGVLSDPIKMFILSTRHNQA